MGKYGSTGEAWGRVRQRRKGCLGGRYRRNLENLYKQLEIQQSHDLLGLAWNAQKRRKRAKTPPNGGAS